jgi:hypothetical protein
MREPSNREVALGMAQGMTEEEYRLAFARVQVWDALLALDSEYPGEATALAERFSRGPAVGEEYGAGWR